MSDENLLETHAREKLGMPPDWVVYTFECLPRDGAGPAQAFLLTGAVCPPLKSGPNRGEPNYRKPDKATIRQAVITRDEHEAWCKEWEGKTGKCHRCWGDGRTVASAGCDGTVTYRPCRDCGGTGKPRAAEGGAA